MGNYKNPGGRPPAYENPEELLEKAMEYIDKCVKKEESPLITGLCLYLGFCSRQSFYDYMKREKFSYTIKRLHLMIEEVYESKLTSTCVAGVIFALKNLGWKDTQEVHQKNDTVQGIEISFKK